MNKKLSKTIIASIFFSAVLTNAVAKAPAPVFNPDDISPACIMAINFNGKIEWEQKNTKKSKAVQVSDDVVSNFQIDFTTESLISFSENAIYEAFEKLEIGFFDKDVLLNSESYLTTKNEPVLINLGTQKPEGYRFLSPDNEVEKKVAEEISADYFIYVKFTINKLLKSGSEKNGKVIAGVTVQIDISDLDGQIVKSVTGYATSGKSITIKKGVINSEEFFALCPETISNSINLAIKDLK